MLEKEHVYTHLWQQTKEYLKLNVEMAKLTLAERVTILLTTVAVSVVAFALALICFFFLSIAIAHWMSESISLAWAYAIMAGFYLLIIVLLVVFKKPLITDPVARFVSKLFLS